MKRLTEKLLHYAVLIVLTICAGWVMVRMSSRGSFGPQEKPPQVRALPTANAPKAPVSIQTIENELCEVTATYAGKIRPWETYSIGFESPGRVISLGENTTGESLDEGDRVSAGQVLAVLDDRVFRAQRGEAVARVEQAASDLKRAQRIRNSSPMAMTESQLQRLVTDQAMARSQLEVASKALEDATLKSPVDATISKRMVNAGETVTMQQMAFELVENDDVLLVLSVPESRIRELEARQRAIESRSASESASEEDRTFRVHVELEGSDTFGHPWPRVDGEVYHIAEVADPRTSLFDVEVRIPNPEGLLRPGMVATAKLVVDRVEGYRIPAAAVIFRQDRAYLFTVQQEPTELEMLYWSMGEVDAYRALKVNIPSWVDQGEYVVVPAEAIDRPLSAVITRGQHRLSTGQLVRITGGLTIPQTNSGVSTAHATAQP
ncbi:efflux RND transporter periplasmic adaptor subunit [Adhaeretor mobilis]|uniref:Putative efflux pump membrane fusion protein n=1 Tax=Adhaeretor mobilis TaxID=1930276 RepID=A0A517MVX1_9BACT|nr:efflux RND transporter periplasmic adaptor subunit [Adhaeretor mobilis]QDS99032.1 putative efflux pump membrane fusion protein [Adhaeretor mobilis]